jgi:hypothetical protein
MSIEGGIRTGALLIFLINISVFIAVIVGVVWGCNKIQEKGLKGCVEAVWEGDSTNAPVSEPSSNLNTMALGGTN